MPTKQILRKRRQTARLFHRIQILLFMGLLIAGSVIGLLIPLRPEVSEQENRKLTEFPDFSFTALLNGDYLNGISTWYADTFPFRDTLMAGSQKIKSMYGLQKTQIIGGGDKVADEIPQIPSDSQPAAEHTTTVNPDSESESSAEKTTVPVPEGGSAIEEAIRQQIQDGLYIHNGAAYSMFYFNKTASEKYAAAMTHAADALKDRTNVYSILIPDSSGALLDDATIQQMGCSNQKQAIDYYYYQMGSQVKTVPVFDALTAHKQEYIYFRTDHHWTQLGAYYAYQEWAKVKGVESHDKSTFQTKSYSGFLGSYYQSSGSAELKANADTVETWIPNDTNEMSFTMTDGTTYDWPIINDVSDYKKSQLYSCFIASDNPYSVIQNPKIKDGSTCVVVKESYGNAFVPWLVDHYQTIYILDFRYYNDNIIQFTKDNKATDLIFINSITIAGSEKVAERIAGLVQ